MMLLRVIVTFLFLPASFIFHANAQGTVSDSINQSAAVTSAIQSYHRFIGTQSAIYSGQAYPGYTFRFQEGHPFFQATEAVLGNVFFDGILYQDVFLKYDVVADQLILHPNTNVQIQLKSELIQYFNFPGHHFVHLKKEQTGMENIGPGFYEQLYDGSRQAFRKEIKTIHVITDATDGFLRVIRQKVTYYIKDEKGYHAVSSKSDVLDLLKDKKKLLQQFIRSAGLDYKKQPEEFLRQVLAYYEKP